MNYLQSPLLNRLAERYVLGTMSRRSRRRFKRIVQDNAAAHEAEIEVEERLAPLAWSADPVTPSDLVWQRIARELRFGAEAPAEPPVDQALSGSRLAAAAAVLALGFGISALGWWQASQREPQVVVQTERVVQPEPAAVTVFSNEDGEAIWVTRIYPASERLEVRVNAQPAAQAGKDYELWALTDEGTPVSLGLLPKTGGETRVLTSTALAALASSQTLAVSLEPEGGSPEATPTGPVLYTGALLAP